MKEYIIKSYFYNEFLVIIFNDEVSKNSSKNVSKIIKRCTDKADIYHGHIILKYKINEDTDIKDIKKVELNSIICKTLKGNNIIKAV